MAHFTPFIKRWWREFSLKTIYEDSKWWGKDPHIFKPSGSQIFHGMQGQGKTLSMWHAIVKLKTRYPRALIVSNLHLRDYKPVAVLSQDKLVDQLEKIDRSTEYLYFEDHKQLMIVLRYARNREFDRGTIFAIDEIHNYFHSHDSKSMPMWVVQVFSQQRKQHLVILGTVQDWEDLIKAIRRQVDNLIACRKSGWLIHQTVVDPREIEMQYGEKVVNVKKRGFFWITKQEREGIDTFQVINSGREILGGSDLSVGVQMVDKKDTKKLRRF